MAETGVLVVSYSHIPQLFHSKRYSFQQGGVLLDETPSVVLVKQINNLPCLLLLTKLYLGYLFTKLSYITPVVVSLKHSN